MTTADKWIVDSGGNWFPSSGRIEKEIAPGFYQIYVTNQGQLYYSSRSARTDLLLRFEGSTIDAVVREIEGFWSDAQVANYAVHGIAHKRGILLYGPPGSGKTSTAHLIARDVVDRGGIVVNFTDPATWDLGYEYLRDVQPLTPVVVLLEDIESHIKKNGASAILDLLDGHSQTERVVFLATTNYPEQLEDRVKNRPSRFDRRYLVGYPGPEDRRTYLASLAREGDGVDVSRMVKDSDRFSFAHLKELFVATAVQGQPYEKALADLRAMQESISSVDSIELPKRTGAGGWL